MKTLITKILIIAILAPFPVFAQQVTAKDSLLDKLTGNWLLRGTIDGQLTTHDIDVAWVLDHQYIQIKEVSREKGASGKPLYEAIVYISFDTTAKQYSCLWLDNTGNSGLSASAVGHAKPNGDKLTFLFQGPGYTFYTTFDYNRMDNTWQWFMDNEVGGAATTLCSSNTDQKVDRLQQ